MKWWYSLCILFLRALISKKITLWEKNCLQKLDQLFCFYFLFPTKQCWHVQEGTFNTNTSHPGQTNPTSAVSKKHTWGKENKPLYCSRIISLVFQKWINVSWCCCIVLIREVGGRLLTLMLNCRLCRPMWGNADPSLWLLLSCSSKVKGSWGSSTKSIVGVVWKMS